MLYQFYEKKIILYGTGGLSQKVKKTLNKNGFEVEAYIDRRAEDIITFLNKNVYSLSQAEVIHNKSDYVIIITTKNVFEHNQIAAELLDIGFKNIIFKNYQILQGEEGDEGLDEAFEYLLNQDRIPEKMIESIEFKTLFSLKDEAYIKDEAQDVYAYLPAFMLFTNTLEDWFWSRVHIGTTFLTVDMYRRFKESCNPEFALICERYIEQFARKGASHLGLNTQGEWETYVIEGRLAVFREMERMLCLSPDFFVKNCPRVQGNPSEGYELISTGKNRVAFLVAKGYEFIPVKMSKECYGEFINISYFNELKKYMEENSVIEFKTTVYHPYLYKFPVKYDRYYELWLERVAKIIVEDVFKKTGKFDFTKKTVKIDCDDDGAASRYFKMLGFQVVNMYPESKLEKLLGETLNFYEAEIQKNDSGNYVIVFGGDSSGFGNYIRGDNEIFFAAGRDLELQGFLVDNSGLIAESKELFSTVWDKSIYRGYKIEKK